ncbi:GNAT family N-acetyltransferase [Alkalitalea saponilacus]|uniref:Ribosomal protein S18 acetylase RimI n=1 Tax=Alkalitalea saponilacus TaxID=889453 RepID=A0A1T5DKT7_9BACT|nr:GNAT family N-acetyltransferase [Alkalitalea saponilacus]ASB50723.1 GNAT family N-acetyltransferase [Alkalitalea saponilacus]SKB72324.1 Ribosomal protein S18 acetylase RimI [Alkalitalea saponilacus]
MNHAIILNSSPELFNQFWSIMVESFPESERKLREDYAIQLKTKLFAIKLFHDESDDLKGFIGWWQLKKHRFVEHFAVSSKFRNQGLGNIIFREFLNENTHPVVLEVEPPIEEMAIRRIGFYERLGFLLHPYSYFQPPYHKEHSPLALQLMTNSPALSEEGFNELKHEVYQTVYGIVS